MKIKERIEPLFAVFIFSTAIMLLIIVSLAFRQERLENEIRTYEKQLKQLNYDKPRSTKSFKSRIYHY